MDDKTPGTGSAVQRLTKEVSLLGTTRYFYHGVLHNLDGPAVIWKDGHSEWWQNGMLHREDGPAVITKDGSKTWYLFDVRYDPILWLVTLQDMDKK